MVNVTVALAEKMCLLANDGYRSINHNGSARSHVWFWQMHTQSLLKDIILTYVPLARGSVHHFYGLKSVITIERNCDGTPKHSCKHYFLLSNVARTAETSFIQLGHNQNLEISQSPPGTPKRLPWISGPRETLGLAMPESKGKLSEPHGQGLVVAL